MSEGLMEKGEEDEDRAGKDAGAVVPRVPGVLRLGWMVFMQPRKLDSILAASGLREFRDLSVQYVQSRVRVQDPVLSLLAPRLAVLLFLATLPAVVLIPAVATALGIQVRWEFIAAGVAGGAASDAILAKTSIRLAVRAVGINTMFGIMLGVAAGVRGGAWVGFTLGLGAGVISSIDRRYEAEPINVATTGLIGGMLGGLVWGAGWGVGWGAGLVLGFLRVPWYLGEAAWTLITLSALRAFPDQAPRLARWLPFRHHDLIPFPLPGLRSFLIALADQDHALTRTLIAEAIDTLAQQTPALRALAELRARSLDRAARNRTWSLAAAFDLPFLPRPDDPSEAASPLHGFRGIAQDLVAARLTTDHHRRRAALTRALDLVTSLRVNLASSPRRDHLEHRLVTTASIWLDVIDDELQTLATLERTNPQIPTPFEPGPALRAEDANLFKGRTDLIRLIDHDLADHRRAPLLLTGQRRIGKTSLLSMLPGRLGTGTLVLTFNFQTLSGNPHRSAPHLWIAAALAKARPDLPSPPPAADPADWTTTLAWLEAVEPSLCADRVVVAIDEVERLQTGIEEGWSSPAFLDFLRATGDALCKIRLLLVSAHPLHRLGRAWTDRLISVVHRDITYLAPDEAEDLITHPMDAFPDIYPPGGVARIAEATRGHPYLVQLVCDALVRDLNGRGKLAAADSDITRALDRALTDTTLFRELWSDRNDAERALLRDLARAPAALGEREAEARDLLDEGLAAKDGDRWRVAVPMFSAWIRLRA